MRASVLKGLRVTVLVIPERRSMGVRGVVPSPIGATRCHILFVVGSDRLIRIG